MDNNIVSPGRFLNTATPLFLGKLNSDLGVGANARVVYMEGSGAGAVERRSLCMPAPTPCREGRTQRLQVLPPTLRSPIRCRKVGAQTCEIISAKE